MVEAFFVEVKSLFHNPNALVFSKFFGFKNRIDVAIRNIFEILVFGNEKTSVFNGPLINFGARIRNHVVEIDVVTI